MSRIEIVNRTQKRFVINSMNLVIGPYDQARPVIRDSVVASDPDVAELVQMGMLEIRNAAPVPPPTPAAAAPQPPKQAPQKAKEKKPVVKESGKKEGGKQKRGTPKAVTFTDPEAASDQMGGKVVVMGANGPETSSMGPGLNAHDGPKYVGDTDGEDEAGQDGTMVEPDKVFRTIT